MKATKLIDTLRHTVEKHALFKPGDTLVVGFSGGADSTALLYLLTSLKDYSLKLIAAHLNHGLRGIDSDNDEEFCRLTSEKLGIQFITKKLNISTIAKKNHINLEDAGRQERISFFDEILRLNSATAVALAHHADDQTETVLMRLLRGSGMTGLSGICYKNEKGYVRPLLDIPSTDLKNWLSQKKISWCEDATNNDIKYLRNRIRHQLIPLLKSYNPSICQTINKTSDLMKTDDDFLQEETFRLFTLLCKISKNSIYFDSRKLLKLHPSIQRRLIRMVYQKLNGSLNSFDTEHCLKIIELCKISKNGRISLPNGIQVYKSYKEIVFTILDLQRDELTPLNILEPGKYTLSDGSQILICEENTTCIKFESKRTMSIDGDKAAFPWLVRSYKAGDIFQPSGMNGHKKIKNLFIDLKIPLQIRKTIPLFIADKEIFWVGGIRHSGKVAISGESKKIITIKLFSPED